MSMHKQMLGEKEMNKGPGSVKTLDDYLQMKIRQEAFEEVNKIKKLSFDEWYNITDGPWRWQFDDKPFIECMKEAWKAGQENK